MTKSKITRREFIEKTTALTVSSAAILPAVLPESAHALATTTTVSASLPQRVLGRTGVKVPILAFGCGSRFFNGYKDEQEAISVLNSVIDQGITYLDTAIDYGKGLSETRVGMVMKTRRKEVFLATKIPASARTRDEALRQVEASLKRLQTDHVNLLHVHSLTSADDLAKIEAPDGVMKALYELRDQKVARFIGITSHTDGAVMAKAIEHNDIDCVQMAMNPARALNFETLALPAAKKKNLGIILMKVTAQEKLVGAGTNQANIEALLRYALSLPVSAAVIGMPKTEFIRQNIEIVRGFKPLTTNQMDSLRSQVASQQASLEHFFLNHKDGHLA